MITHYGLFWSERDVFWGRPKKEGQMLGHEKTPLERRGRPTKDIQSESKDYRDYVGLYCLYGVGGLLYVGEAGLSSSRTLFDRLKSHRKGSMAGRWDKFSWFGREQLQTEGKCDTNIALAQLEAIVIAIINPGFNKQSGTFKSATQVFQFRHVESERTLEGKIEELEGKIEDIYDMVKKLPVK